MTRHTRFFILFILFTYHTNAQQFGGNLPGVNWKETGDAYGRVIFPAGADSQAARIGHILSVLNRRDEKQAGRPIRRWPVLLQSQTVVPNAYVRLAPVMSEFMMTPPQDNFSQGSLRWDDNLIIHEQRHMRQFSLFNRGLTRVFSFFLGQEGQLLANGISIPDYFFEGDAVWQETAISRQGRGRLPGFLNTSRAIWQEGKDYSWMTWRSGSLRKLLPDHYELGYMMVAHGNKQYGNEFWNKVSMDASRFRSFFYPFAQAIKQYSGKPYQSFTREALAAWKQNLLKGDQADGPVPEFITSVSPKNVMDYLFPVCLGPDSMIVSRRSYRDVPAFYLLTGGREQKIRTRDFGLDEYYSANHHSIVYAAYETDPRWGNREFSVLKLVDIATGSQRTLTHRSRYFSPVLHPGGGELLAVQVNTNGESRLDRISVSTGQVIASIPNPGKLFFTQSAYINDNLVVSAVRSPNGSMALVTIDLSTGVTDELVPFSFTVLGYPVVHGDSIYFNAQDTHTDQVFSVSRQTGQICRVTSFRQPVYYPAIEPGSHTLFCSIFTASGYRLGKTVLPVSRFQPIDRKDWGRMEADWQQWQPLTGESQFLDTLKIPEMDLHDVKKGKGLVNFHSRRPVLDDPEWGYSLYSDNFFSSLTGTLTYTYNRIEKSHTFGAGATFGGWFPFIGAGAEVSLNRNMDTALGRSVQFNSAKWTGGVSIPLQWIRGRAAHSMFGALSYNHEQLYYRGIGKNIFSNKGFNYIRAGFSFSRSGRQAKQHIYPHWAQSLSAIYRHSVSDPAYRKFTANSAWYFPGISANHSFVVLASFQKRDSLPDIYSNTFSYSRGYDALSTRQMYKWGINYHLPLAYPDLGFGNILYCQRIRANVFYDHTVARARLNAVLTDIKNRSAGAEVFFDNKLWNSLPLSFGVRYAYLLDRNLRDPSVKSRWEIVLPVGLIPN